MTIFRATLFGSPQFSLGQHNLTNVLTGRLLGLLSYLIVTGKPYDRGVLADLLWHELSEREGKTNLRYVLYHLRQAMGDHLIVTRHTIAFSKELPHWCDVSIFRSYLAGQHIAREPELLHDIINLYQGEFLEGFYVQAAPIFEEWLANQRRQLHTTVIDALQTLADHYAAQGNGARGLAVTNRWLSLAPWDENGHRHQMRFLAFSNQRSAALAHYEHCVKLLATELDVPPMPETVTLYETIKSGVWFSQNHLAGVSTHQAITLKPNSAPLQPLPTWETAGDLLIDLGTMPRETSVYGRQAELSQLTRWINHDACRVVAILGIGGQGKTTLAAKFTETLAANLRHSQSEPAPFTCIVWRSLVNAPLPADFVASLRQQLGSQTPAKDAADRDAQVHDTLSSDMPAIDATANQIAATEPGAELFTDLDRQLALLLQALRRQRCLIVIDNVESILQAGGHAGLYLPGYEGYGQLLRALTHGDHRSTILVTSRERPRDLFQTEEKLGRIRSLHLGGLPFDAASQLFDCHGIAITQADLHELLQRLSGNPLSLKQTIAIIAEIFHDDVRAFLTEDLLFGDNVSTILDQQLARLSPAEQEIIVSLAQDPKPVAGHILLARWRHSSSKQTYLNAVRSLQHRSLLQDHDQTLALQTIIFEYMKTRASVLSV